jgi:hypothetical protein
MLVGELLEAWYKKESRPQLALAAAPVLRLSVQMFRVRASKAQEAHIEHFNFWSMICFNLSKASHTRYIYGSPVGAASDACFRSKGHFSQASIVMIKVHKTAPVAPYCTSFSIEAVLSDTGRPFVTSGMPSCSLHNTNLRRIFSNLLVFCFFHFCLGQNSVSTMAGNGSPAFSGGKERYMVASYSGTEYLKVPLWLIYTRRRKSRYQCLSEQPSLSGGH